MHWAGYLSTQNRRSICLSGICLRKKNKQFGLGNAFENTSLKLLAVPLKFWKTRKSLQVCFHESMLHNLKTPRPKKTALNYLAFLLITLVDSTSFLIHCYNFYPQLTPRLQIFHLRFFLE